MVAVNESDMSEAEGADGQAGLTAAQKIAAAQQEANEKRGHEAKRV